MAARDSSWPSVPAAIYELWFRGPCYLRPKKNIAIKFLPEVLGGHYLQLVSVAPILVAVPSPGVVATYEPVVSEDAHVLAATLAASVPYLLTLDRALIQRLAASDYPILALTPRDFIQSLLPSHPDHPRDALTVRAQRPEATHLWAPPGMGHEAAEGRHCPSAACQSLGVPTAYENGTVDVLQRFTWYMVPSAPEAPRTRMS